MISKGFARFRMGMAERPFAPSAVWAQWHGHLQLGHKKEAGDVGDTGPFANS